MRYQASRFFVAHDYFIAADRPEVVSAKEGDAFLFDEDQVLGFYLDGVARAYSIQAISYHHVVNDVIGETPLVVTY